MSRKSTGNVKNDLLWDARRLDREEMHELLYKSKLTQLWKPCKANNPISIVINYELRPLIEHTIITTTKTTMDTNEPQN